MLLKAIETFGTYKAEKIYPFDDETGADMLKLHPNLFARAPDDALDAAAEVKVAKGKAKDATIGDHSEGAGS